MRQETYYKLYSLLQALSLLCLFVFGFLQCSINQKLTEINQETNFRPVILRSSYTSWGLIKPIGDETKYNISEEYKKTHFIEFTILRNIATDVNGELALNGYKYRLHFFNDIGQIDTEKISCEPKWGWTKPDSKLYAFCSEMDREKTDKENYLQLNYKDIRGNKYNTIENKNFSSKVCRAL